MFKLMENSSEMTTAQRLYHENPLPSYTAEELHSRLIDFENPDLLYEDGENRPSLTIVDDTVVEVNDVRIKLTPTKVFILNALRLSQGYPQSRAEMMDIGFNGTNSPFINGINELAAALEHAGGVQYIHQQKAHKTPSLYTLLPEIRILDERKKRDPWKEFVYRSVATTDEQRVSIRENGAIDFKSIRARVEATAAMLRDYQHIVDINKIVANMLGDSIGKRSETIATLPARNNRRTSPPEDDEQLLQLKEEALLEYLSKGPSGSQIEIIRAGITASMELFVSNLDLPYMLSRKLLNSRVLLSDLYQEGAAQLLELIFATGVNNQREYSFRYIAGEYIRRNHDHGMLPLIESSRMPVGIPVNVGKQLVELAAAVEALTEENGIAPSISAVAARLKLQKSTVIGLTALRSDFAYLDEPIGDNSETIGDTLEEDDFVSAHLDRMEREDALNILFTSNELDDKEKIILSLQYKTFHSSLRGAEYSVGKQTVFVYPHDIAVFETLTAGSASIGALLHETTAAVKQRCTHALRKARSVLISHELYQEYAETEALEIRAKEEAEHNERQELISLAHELSPQKRLGAKQVQELFSSGAFPASPKHVARLFGSFAAFQEACGFQPKRKPNLKDVSNEDLIALALELRPSGPLSNGDIAALCKEGKFISLGTIKSRFGNPTEFRRQCGFE